MSRTCTFADVAKIERLLHWRARTSLEDGVARMLERIDDWRDAPVWEPASIAQATSSWFAHLGGVRVVSQVCVPGGAGYVGAVLVPKLLARGHRVTVLDNYQFGRDVFANIRGAAGLREVEGDVRDRDAVARALAGCDAVIHLACVSNDPSFELDPELSKSINYDCFPMFLAESKRAGVKRFIYASSSSVYGVSEVPDVREDHPLLALTDYSKYKALCEPFVLAEGKAPTSPRWCCARRRSAAPHRACASISRSTS